MQGSGFKQDGLDEVLELLFGQEAFGDARHTAAGDKEKHRDGRSLEEISQLLLAVHVDLVEKNLVAVLLGQFFEDRRETAAGTAPVGIKIDDAGKFTPVVPGTVGSIVEDALLKVLGSEIMSRLGMRREGGAEEDEKGKNEFFFHKKCFFCGIWLQSYKKNITFASKIVKKCKKGHL